MKRLARFLLAAIVFILVLAIVMPLLIPIRPLPTATARPADLADPDSRFIDIDGLRVHYRMQGQGKPTIILLHGFLASTFSWREVMAPLSQVGRVIAYDRPAFGLTERPLPGDWRGPNPYAAGYQPDLLIGLMDALGVEKAVLIGNSAGGTVAAWTALRHPERVEALVLVDAAIYTGGGPPGFVQPLLRTPQAERLGLLLVRQMPRLGARLGEMAWHDPSKLTPDVWEGYSRPLRIENWDRALWQMTQASAMPSLAPRLKDIAVPVLVVTGDDDRIVPTAQSLRLAQDIPGAQLAVIAAAGHTPHEEQPREFLEAVVPFLVSENR